MPERYGPWETVYTRFNHGCREGVWERVLERLQARMEARGQIDWELFCIDGSVVIMGDVRARRSGAGRHRRCAGAELGLSAGHMMRQQEAKLPAERWPDFKSGA